MNDFIERVIIQLDAASETREAIDTAARLAALAQAPLQGIFVEDEDLLGLANLPFARHVTLGTGTERLIPEHVERQLRVVAERARRDLDTAAERHGVAWSFEIVRGSSERALAGASERDLIVAGALTRPVAGQFRLGCRWWPSISAAPGPFLLARRRWEANGGVLIVLRDESQGSVRLLETAVGIAEARNPNLTVIGPADVVGVEGIETWVTDHLARHPGPLQIEQIPTERAELHRRMLELDYGLVAVEAGFVEDGPDRMRELVERLACDLLVVC